MSCTIVIYIPAGSDDFNFNVWISDWFTISTIILGTPVPCPCLNSRTFNENIQLNEYKTDLYFPQNFQWTTMLIYAFFKICEQKCEREIVFVTKIKTKQFQVQCSVCVYPLENLQKSKQNNFKFSVQFTNLTIRALEILKIIWTCLKFI